MAENVKTAQGLAIASVKTLQGLAIADAKTILGVDNTGSGGITEVTHTDGAGAAGGTSGNVDTTGANLLVAACAYLQGGGGPTFSDSKSNSWTATTELDSGQGPALKFFYCVPSSVGSGHNFTIGGGQFMSFVVVAFSGANATPYDTISAGHIGVGSSFTPGPINTAVDGEVVCVGNCSNPGTASATGYTYYNKVFAGGVNYGSALGFAIKASAGAENPTVNFSESSAAAVQLIAFKPA